MSSKDEYSKVLRQREYVHKYAMSAKGRKKRAKYAREHSRSKASRASRQKYYAIHKEHIKAYNVKKRKDPAYRKKLYEAQQRYNSKPNNKIKIAARRALYRAIKTGKIVKQDCKCGSTKSGGHHCDYNKKLDVIWFCAQCHKDWHMKNNIKP